MPHIHAHLRESDEEALDALEAYKEKICKILARSMDEPIESVALLPKTMSDRAFRAAHNVDRLELEAYTGDSHPPTLGEDEGNAQVAEVLETILGECPKLRTIQWSLWIRCSILWGYARHDPQTEH